MHLNCDEGEAFRSRSQWSLQGALVQTSLRDLGTGVSMFLVFTVKHQKTDFPLEMKGAVVARRKASCLLFCLIISLTIQIVVLMSSKAQMIVSVIR